MLYPYQEAAKLQSAIPRSAEVGTPGGELLSLLCGLGDWLGEAPEVHYFSQGKNLHILYGNASFPIDDFWRSFGLGMAAVHETWPVCVLGTAENQETVRLTARAEQGVLHLVQESISGKKVDLLETLCIQMDCSDGDTEHLIRLLEALNWETRIAPMGWRDGDFLREQGLLLKSGERGLFCYGGADSEAGPEECLLSLGFAQKVSLWTAFLKEGLEPAEFEWLAAEIREGTVSNRLEWELALGEAVDQCEFRVVNQKSSFELFDAVGRRLYFGADCRRPAEWSLLKVLFPLNF